jgi:hypothetical protein
MVFTTKPQGILGVCRIVPGLDLVFYFVVLLPICTEYNRNSRLEDTVKWWFKDREFLDLFEM